MAKSRKRQGDPSVPEGQTPMADRQGNGGNGGGPDPQTISTRAYELYLARGGSDGQAWDDWLAAERELTEGRTARNQGDSGE